jgi:chitinase
LKVLISIGGWTWSSRFSDAARSDASRQKFVKSCLDLYLVQYRDTFDGVDIDWEYPVSGGLTPGRPEDTHNFTLLMEEFRRQMDTLQQSTGRSCLLTFAGSASREAMSHIELGELSQSVDWINLMAYDFHVATEPTTGFLAPLYGSHRDPDPTSRTDENVDAAVRGYLAAGVPAKKIVLGIPFYGRAWQGATGDGLFAPAAGPASAKYEPGYMDYTELLGGPLLNYTHHWDDDVVVRSGDRHVHHVRRCPIHPMESKVPAGAWSGRRDDLGTGDRRRKPYPAPGGFSLLVGFPRRAARGRRRAIFRRRY